MPIDASGAGRFVAKNGPKVGKFIVANAPKVVGIAGVVNAFLKEHPDLPAWARGRIEGVAERIADVPHRHGVAAQIRGKLDIIRDEARALAAEQADAESVDTAGWVKRANNIDHGVRLGERQAQPARRKTLALLRAEADALLAEIIDVIALGGSRPPAE